MKGIHRLNCQTVFHLTSIFLKFFTQPFEFNLDVQCYSLFSIHNIFICERVFLEDQLQLQTTSNSISVTYSIYSVPIFRRHNITIVIISSHQDVHRMSCRYDNKRAPCLATLTYLNSRFPTKCQSIRISGWRSVWRHLARLMTSR